MPAAANQGPDQFRHGTRTLRQWRIFPPGIWQRVRRERCLTRPPVPRRSTPLLSPSIAAERWVLGSFRPRLPAHDLGAYIRYLVTRVLQEVPGPLLTPA